MKKYYFAIALALGALSIWMIVDREDELVSDVQGHRPGQAIEDMTGNAAREVKARQSQAKDEMTDGVVVREWGSLVKAKDIRVNCRSEQQVVRDVPRPEDYVRKCDTKTVFDHSYAGFSDEQLAQIADTDAEAAYLLAHRLLVQPSDGGALDDNPERGLSYAMNALAHSGDKQIFDLFIDGRNFRNWSVWARVNGIPKPRQVAEKAEEYKWYKVGRNLGYINASDYRWKKVSGQVSNFENYFDIEKLDTEAATISEGIQNAQERFAEAS